MDPSFHDLIAALHQSSLRCVLAFTGGGTQAGALLLNVGVPEGNLTDAPTVSANAGSVFDASGNLIDPPGTPTSVTAGGDVVITTTSTVSALVDVDVRGGAAYSSSREGRSQERGWARR